MFETPNKQLIALFCTKDWDSAVDESDSGPYCTSGLDDPNASEFEILQKGFDLAVKAALSGGKVYMFESDDQAICFIAKDEAELDERIEALLDDEGRDDEDDEDDD